LESAFERNSPEAVSYLDLTSGEVVALLADAPDYEERRGQVAAAPSSFARIDPVSSREQYRWMEKFVTCVADEALLQRLLIAIDGKGAFRRFKDVLTGYPVDRERWFTYRSELLHYHMQGWLAQHGISSTTPPPWGEVEAPQELEPVLERPAITESPGELFRRQAKELIDGIPAIDLPSAIVFLEFLKERGVQELTRTAASARGGSAAVHGATRPKSGATPVPASGAASEGGAGVARPQERAYGRSLEEALDSERDRLVAAPRTAGHPS
jgi:hypothetical protein